MEGVTILSAATVALGLSWGVVFFVAFGAGLLACLLMTLQEEDGISTAIISVIVAIVIFILGAFLIGVDTTEVTEYKVIIDDSVSYVEFMEKYEVIDQEGEIYTVRERTGG